MKIVLKILGGLALLVLLLAVSAFFLPRKYRVERTIIVKATPDAVFAQFGDLRAWKNWGVWYERDPAMKVTYSEKTVGVGAWSSWESKTEGNGKLTVTAYDAPKSSVYRLEFPDYGMTSMGSIGAQPAEGGVRVV